MYSAQVSSLYRYLGVKLNTRRVTSPISITRILEHFNIALYHQHYGNTEDVSGILIRRNGKTRIFVNADHHYNRRRFSVSHEFGHYYLDHPDKLSSLVYEDFEHRVMEYEANQFASCLLMPVELVSGMVKQDKTIKEMAQWFRVSNIAAAIRCLNLGYRVEEAEMLISDYHLERGEVEPMDYAISQLETSDVDKAPI